MIADGGSPADGGAAPDGGTPASVSVSYAIHQRNTGGGLGMVLPVSVGGASPVGLLLDTGSTALRVFTSALGAAAVQRTTQSVTELYADGTTFQGVLGTARVAIGDAATDAPISVHLVDTVTCDPSKPSCPVSATGERHYTDYGMSGILGVSLRAKTTAPDLYSPLAQLPGNLGGGFILRSGRYGSSSGTLVIGLTADNTAGFAQGSLAAQTGVSAHPNGVPTWDDTSLQVCFTIGGTTVQAHCTPMVFDTGSTALSIVATGVPTTMLQNGDLISGTSVEMASAGLFDVSFTVGNPVTSGVDNVAIHATGTHANSGIEMFFRRDLLFDARNGRIGFREN
jgi:hypothetical protein